MNYCDISSISCADKPPNVFRLSLCWSEKLERIQVFGKGVRWKETAEVEMFKISSPQKRDFRHYESACFNISFLKVKMPFFLHQNITKLRKNDANLHL